MTVKCSITPCSGGSSDTQVYATSTNSSFEYKVNNGNVTHVVTRQDVLDIKIDQQGRSYYQVGHKLYGIADGIDVLYVYNLKSQTLENTFDEPSEFDGTQNDFHDWQCLCYSDSLDMLFVSGQWAVIGFSLTTHQWDTSFPDVSAIREYHGCIVDDVHEYLWMIGGNNRDTVEWIPVCCVDM